MTACRRIRRQLVVSRREWSAAERERVSAHLQSCAACAAVAEEWAAQERLLAALPGHGMSPERQRELVAQARREDKGLRARARLTQGLSTAAGVLVLALMTVAVTALVRHMASWQGELATTTPAHPPVRTLPLPDVASSLRDPASPWGRVLTGAADRLRRLVLSPVPALLTLAGLALLGVGLLWRRRRVVWRVGAGVLAGGLVAMALRFALMGLGPGSTVTLLRALTLGLRYDPRVNPPPAAVWSYRPETYIGRQLDALIGRTGPSPLREDAALAGYELLEVRISRPREWGTRARVTARLDWRDGSEETRSFPLIGSGPSFLRLLLGDTTGVWVGDWRNSPLDALLTDPAPAVPLSEGAAPFVLAPIDTIDAGALEESAGYVDIAVPSDIAADGRVLFDQDVRSTEGSRSVNRLMLYRPGGGAQQIAETFLSARGAFSLDGRRVLYVDSQKGSPSRLMVWDGGASLSLGEIDWMTHHWVGDDTVAYSARDRAYLHSLVNGSRQSLATLPVGDTVRAWYFRVAPDGEHIAYSTADGGLWLRSVSDGSVAFLGWDVSELSWGAGMAWDARGERLAYSTMNRTTLPDQAALWVRDIHDSAPLLLARSAPGFLDDDYVPFGKVCWVGEGTVLFAADRPNKGDVRLLAAAVDGSGLWDVTPSGLSIPFAEVACSHGYVVVPTSRTQLELLQIVPAQAIAEGRR
jgi:anti-sigma factor RsiW